MKISESWLREWVSPPLSSQEMSQQLTMAGLEVDTVNPVASAFDNVIVAQVLKTKPHPQADKLTLCEVDAGTAEPLQIVCGAPNVREGLRVALAKIGAHLPGGIQIKAAKLRGEFSQGMLCSASELGMDDRSQGILELAKDAPIGMNLRDYLALDDVVFDIDLTPNRADCLSVLGVAREIAALNQLPLNAPVSEPVVVTIPDALAIALKESKAAPQYAGRVIKGINLNAVTPVWMKEKLRRCGIRPLHPVVDITNYVMLELGQPLHAFDLKALKGSIQVRYAADQESLTLLDNQTVKLDSQVLVIADCEKVLAMAGIMGGDQSAVKSNTTDIFLESAFFNPIAIAGVARRFGLNSDASLRFERGVDPNLQSSALERATYLLKTIVGGEIGPVVLVNNPEQLPQAKRIQFNPKQVSRLSGLNVPHDVMERMLKSLGMIVIRHETSWDVEVPSYRFDVAQDVDLVEEVIRLYGYQKIPSVSIHSQMQAGQINSQEQLSMKIGSFLANRGYRETISYSFVDPKLQQALYPEEAAMRLVNPISPELSTMRISLWPGLLTSMLHNIRRQQSALKLFECGVVFQRETQQIDESPHAAGLIIGSYGQLNWSEVSCNYDFYDMKGDLEALFMRLNQEVRFQPAVHPTLHPGKAAKMTIGSEELGWIGVLHPRFMDLLDVSEEIILFDLSLNVLPSSQLKSYQSVSKYPQTRRDLSLIVDEAVTARQIEEAVREVVDQKNLKSFDIFDVYKGESIPKHKKSLAIALTFQNDTRTLIDDEINVIIEKIIKQLETAFSIALRV